MESAVRSDIGLKLSESNNGNHFPPRTRFKTVVSNEEVKLLKSKETEMPPAETLPLMQTEIASVKEKPDENETVPGDVDVESGIRPSDLLKTILEEDTLTLNDACIYNTVTSNASFYQRRNMELLTSLKQKGPKESQRAGNNSFIMVLSALYAKMLIVMGLAFPISEVISPVFTASSYMVFYVYLYGGSIIYLIYVFATLLRSRAEKTARGYWNRVRSFSVDRRVSCGAETPRQPSPGIRSRSGTFSEPTVVKTSHHEQHGSFYLRIGAVAFGVGSMIYSGLEFGQYFEIDVNSKCHDVMLAVTPAARMLFTFIQMYFIFLNSKMPVNRHRTIAYFGLMHVIATNLCVWLSVIVEETKHEIIHNLDKHGHLDGNFRRRPSFISSSLLTRRLFSGKSNQTKMDPHLERTVTNLHHYTTSTTPFGLMDSETNSSFTDFSSSTETLGDFITSAIHRRFARGAKKVLIANVSDGFTDEIGALDDECRRADVMGNLVQDASPFLFPCAIEYSLICAAILYVMWKNTSNSSVKITEPDGIFPKRSRHHYSVDCARANKGLFLGLFILVLTIISLILFFALINRPEYVRMAMIQVNFTRLIIYSITIIAALVGMISIRTLRFDTTRTMELDDILLVMGQVGVFSYNIFTIVAAYNDQRANFDTYLVLSTALGSIAQAVTQSLFILDASRRFTVTKEEYKRKPAREIVTFLLVCNFAMWSINTMEKSRTETVPMQLNFFGNWSWIVITNISMPLAIFYRFHSTVCLCEIWKRCYKVKPDY